MRTTRPRARKWVEEWEVERFWGLLFAEENISIYRFEVGWERVSINGEAYLTKTPAKLPTPPPCFDVRTNGCKSVPLNSAALALPKLGISMLPITINAESAGTRSVLECLDVRAMTCRPRIVVEEPRGTPVQVPDFELPPALLYWAR